MTGTNQTRTRSLPRRTARSPIQCLLAWLVLGGYLLVLGGSSAGHGWHLFLHLLSQHHGPSLHEHTVSSPHPDTPADASESHAPAPPDPSEGVPHEHEGQAHVHGSHQDHEQGAPALPNVALDEHYLSSYAHLSPPPVLDRDLLCPVAAWPSAAPPVEERPPRGLV